GPAEERGGDGQLEGPGRAGRGGDERHAGGRKQQWPIMVSTHGPSSIRGDAQGPAADRTEAKMGFLLRVVVNALAIMLAASIVPGIAVDGLVSALAAAVLLGLINAFVRPVLLILTLPITLLTLGLFLLVLNGFCFWLVAWLVKGFHVAGF